ncbi:MAG TPA: hypothetical protein VHE79_07985, partial [Spirochaetia bacterium]
MKRAFSILVGLVVLAAFAEARPYTYLEPPSIAVVDFEVSMSAAEKEAPKTFYGQLISQALLSALVQQNAAAVVKVPAAIDAPPLNVAGANGANTGGEDVRRYFPPLLKVYDKKYVELALQNATYTPKDLYTKSVGAFSFTDLDYIVLGNVYEAQRATGATTRDAIGYNVRVLNTKRSEELYSYSDVIDKDLSELSTSCARIARVIVRDILTSTCGQFIITDISGVKTPYRLFWQPKQVEREDNTVADSTDADKRELAADRFYWVLPGQYVLSVYNVETQRLRAIPFTIAAGDIRHVTVEKQHLEVERGSVTIGGIFPTDSYVFKVKEQRRREQYWWEVGGVKGTAQDISVSFSNGENPEVRLNGDETADPKDKDAVKAEYRAATNEIVIRNVMLSSYDITATLQPPASSYDITGWWKVSTRQISQSSTPISLDLRTQVDAKLQIADFGLQQKKALDSPRKMKITFLMNPGFGYSTTLYIDDGSGTGADWLWWRNKEKVTIESEYSQAEWDTLPFVTYEFDVNGAFGGVTNPVFQKQFRKADLDPSRDVVVILDMNAEAAAIKGGRDAAEARRSAERAATTASTQAAERRARGESAAAGTTPGGTSMYLSMAGAIGGGSVTYYKQSGSYIYDYDSGDLEFGGNLGLLFPLGGIGIGAGVS